MNQDMISRSKHLSLLKNVKRKSVFNKTILLFLFLSQSFLTMATVWHVKPIASGDGLGSSWANASDSLQVMMDDASAGDTIWVAAGTYYPTSSPDDISIDSRDKAFHLSKNIKIYGGFAGTETMLSERDWTTNVTILSGDFGNNDVVSGIGANLLISNTTENAYHVFMVTTATSPILDGFTIKGGNANGPGKIQLNNNQFFRSEGGGIYVRIGNIQLANLTIIGNNGGGLNIDGSTSNTPITNVRVLKNVNHGLRINTTVDIRNSTFSGNKGPGIYLYTLGYSNIRNSIISYNSVHGVYDAQLNNKYINCTFYGNSADYGGGLGLFRPYSVATIKNCIFWDNEATGTYSGASTTNEIYYDETGEVPTVQYCLTQPGSPFISGTGNINSMDPLLINPEGGDFRLLSGSPALDAGDNNTWSATGLSTDIAGNLRPQNTTVDMGAYEGITIPAIIYVDSSATSGTKNGASWSNAYTDVQDAIDNPYGTSEIWVAKGTYYPTQVPDGNTIGVNGITVRDKSYHLATDMEIYGGFAGTETMLSERNWTINETILSGDFGDNDVISGSGASLSITNNTENAYHVIITANLTSAAKIDGFTVKAGNATDVGNLVFNSNDFYKGYGGGLYNFSSSPSISNSTFQGNSATLGGGLYNLSSSPSINNAIFQGNSAEDGGGLCNYYSNHSIINTTFRGNSAEDGGGLYNVSSSLIVVNSIFWENSGNGSPNSFYNNNSTLSISHSLIPEANSTTLSTNSNGGITSISNMVYNQDPQFTDAANGDLSLKGCSPAINTGDNAAWATTVLSTDLAGNPRPFGDSVVDMGAYEFQGNNPFTNAIYVKHNANGDNNGSTWADAYTDLQDAIDNQCGSLPIWVAAGTYYPTAGTDRTISFAIPDGVKLYGGFAGTETLLAQRDWTTHETILSGDIGTQNDNADNSYHVVYTKNVSSETLMDGFTVSDGKAEAISGSIWHRNGGAWYNDGSGTGNSSNPSVRNCTFSDNSGVHGGAIYNDSRSYGVISSTLSNCTFSGNSAASEGGAIYYHGTITGVSSPTLSNCTFLGNSAVDNGGAMYFGGSGGSGKAEVINCTFQDNGNDHIGYDDAEQGAQHHFVNCTFTGATAYAINIPYWDSGEALLDFTNCIFWGNNGDILGGNAGTDNARLNIINSIVEEAAFAGSNNNINQNPQFLDAANGFLQLKCNSPAINQGTATGAPTDDITGFTRVGLPDMGAYEYGQTVVDIQIPNGTNPSLNGIPILKASSQILNTNTVLFQGVNNVQLLPGFSVAPTGGAATVFRAEVGGGCE
jgi:predicted outer membrane repeat protein